MTKIDTLLNACEVAEREALATGNHDKYLDSIFMQDALYALDGEHKLGMISDKELARNIQRYKAWKIRENEINLKIQEANKSYRDENYQLKLKNGILEKEVEILTKAFENMGFDVKDMKDILNKLVDGIISKNEIKLIK